MSRPGALWRTLQGLLRKEAASSRGWGCGDALVFEISICTQHLKAAVGFQGALRVGGWGVHSEQGTFELRKQTQDKRENARFKENIEQRGAARKYFSVSDLSAAGASDKQVFISLQPRPPPACASVSGVLPVAGEAGKGERCTLAACTASWR